MVHQLLLWTHNGVWVKNKPEKFSSHNITTELKSSYHLAFSLDLFHSQTCLDAQIIIIMSQLLIIFIIVWYSGLHLRASRKWKLAWLLRKFYLSIHMKSPRTTQNSLPRWHRTVSCSSSSHFNGASKSCFSDKLFL